ncbi:MAG: hypothetical protein JJ863_33915 [Deltaproteobacteria bacterium]|nr:hypothetical protein [Deltaproteobacteria bacterium]
MTALRLSLALLFVVACGVVTPYTITRPVPEQTVEGSPLGAVLPGVEIPIPLEIDLEAEADAQNAGPVQTVTLEALRLDITTTAEPAGDTDDWDFVDSVVIYVESSEPGSALARREVARLDPTPNGVRQLEMDTDTSVNLRPYVDEGARLTATVRGRAPADDVSYDGVVTLGLSFL